VERVNRELEQGFLAWLTGQVVTLRPTILDYDHLAQGWIEERVLPRRHRTTGNIVSEAWEEERRLLTSIPAHVLQRITGEGSATQVLEQFLAIEVEATRERPPAGTTPLRPLLGAQDPRRLRPRLPAGHRPQGGGRALHLRFVEEEGTSSC
jgi:hypothetical protein